MTWDDHLKDNPKCVWCGAYLNTDICGGKVCSETCAKTMETLGYEEE